LKKKREKGKEQKLEGKKRKESPFTGQHAAGKIV